MESHFLLSESTQFANQVLTLPIRSDRILSVEIIYHGDEYMSECALIKLILPHILKNVFRHSLQNYYKNMTY